jgi:hypothetical protein
VTDKRTQAISYDHVTVSSKSYNSINQLRVKISLISWMIDEMAVYQGILVSNFSRKTKQVLRRPLRRRLSTDPCGTYSKLSILKVNLYSDSSFYLGQRIAHIKVIS